MRAVKPSPRDIPQWQWRRVVGVVLPILGLVWLVQGARMIHKAARPHHDLMITAGACHTPATVLEPALPSSDEADATSGNVNAGSAVVFHGLAANRRLMTYLGDYLVAAGWRVYLLDLPGHGANTDPFSFARVAECAAETVESLMRSKQIDPARTVVVGHSMGGSIALRLADREPVVATIAISPGPVPPPKRMPSNLLVFSAQFDPPHLHAEAESLVRDAGGQRLQADDFAQRRAFELRTIPYATHTSVLHNPEVIEESVRWIVSSFHSDMPPQAQMAALSAYWMAVRANPPTQNLLGSISGALGMLALFPLFATLAAGVAGARDAPPETSLSVGSVQAPRTSFLLAEGAACSLGAAALLKLGTPLKFLRLYDGDYLMSLLLIIGMLLLALNWRYARQEFTLALHSQVRPLIAAALLGFATFLGVSAWFNWQITDLSLNAPRWLRFAELLPLACVFCFVEEILLGPLPTGWKRAARYSVALLMRLEFWAACALAYYTLGNGQVLLLLLVVYLAAFSIFQRLGADALRRRTGSAAAPALFNAILAAWFIAAVFPLT